MASNSKRPRKFIPREENVQNTNKNEYERDDYCWACIDGDFSNEKNKILYCDNCNVPVHQLCYDIYVIPKDHFYCDPCLAGKNPLILDCQLCSNKGGIYRQTTDGKWVHVLCANWIPEVFLEEQNGQKYYNISKLEIINRFKMKCEICSTKHRSCAVQCCHKRCLRSAHPWCIFKDKRSNFHFSYHDQGKNGDSVFKVYCESHSPLYEDCEPANFIQRNKDVIDTDSSNVKTFESKSNSFDHFNLLKRSFVDFNNTGNFYQTINSNNNSESSFTGRSNKFKSTPSDNSAIASAKNRRTNIHLETKDNSLYETVNNIRNYSSDSQVSSGNTACTDINDVTLVSSINKCNEIEIEKNKILKKQLLFLKSKHDIDYNIKLQKLKLKEEQLKRKKYKDKIELYNLLIANATDESMKNKLKNEMFNFLLKFKNKTDEIS